MQKETLSNSNISIKNKKPKNKINEKTSSTGIDSNSQKSNSHSNKNSENKQKSFFAKNFDNSKFSEKSYIYMPINELKQFKTWNSSNLNAIYQNIVSNEKENYLHIKPNFRKHFDINNIHRTILVDWLINVHLYFKLSDECLYLSIKLIDIFLARSKNFTKNKLQLLGICSLQLASKYIEQIHPSINNLSDLCDKCYKKKEIIKFEKYLLIINDYIIEQNPLLNYYDLISLILKFNIKYYYFGKMLLDLTLLDINFYKYQKNTIIFSICSLVIYNSKMINDITDNFELYIQECQKEKHKLKIFDFSWRINTGSDDICDITIINQLNYLFSFYPLKDYSLVIECTKEIVALYENIKTSKYNSAVQKFFITLKEIKIESLSDQTKDVYTRDNQQENRNFEKFEETNDNIEMIIEN